MLFRSSIMQAMQTTQVLSNRSPPGYGEREKQRIKPRIVKSLADIPPRRQKYSLLIIRNFRQTCPDRLECSTLHATAQHDQITNNGRHGRCQAIQVLIALRQDDGRAALACRLNDVVADEPVAGFVCNELVVELMKLDSDIRIALLQGTKPSRANKNDVLERPRGGLLRRIDAMAHRHTA